MDYRAYYRKAPQMSFQDYCDAIAAAQGIDPQATARTRDAEGTIPGEAREKLFNIAAEIKNTFHEFGAPLPPLPEGCTVLDLCCGSGRDTYLAAQLTGAAGKVIGVEPNVERLTIAKKYLAKEITAKETLSSCRACPRTCPSSPTAPSTWSSPTARSTSRPTKPPTSPRCAAC